MIRTSTFVKNPLMFPSILSSEIEIKKGDTLRFRKSAIFSSDVVLPLIWHPDARKASAKGSPSHPHPKMAIVLLKTNGFRGQNGIIKYKRHGNTIFGSFGNRELLMGQ